MIQCATLVKKTLMSPVECIFIGELSINIWINWQNGWSLREPNLYNLLFKLTSKNLYGESFSNLFLIKDIKWLRSFKASYIKFLIILKYFVKNGEFESIIAILWIIYLSIRL